MEHYIASCSFGKDSIATALLALEHGEPLHELVYCEIMFDEHISGEVPEHRDFIYNTAIPAFERIGVNTVVLRSEATYKDRFTQVISRGKRKGKISSFPLCGRCKIQRDCKLPPLHEYQKSISADTIQYVGLATDEQERLARLSKQQISLLDKYSFTEKDALTLCKRHNLLSPIYTFAQRNGCWFCPNAGETELRHLYDYHQDLWQKMRKLQALPNKATEKFNRTMRFTDIDMMFRLEDAQMKLEDFVG